MQNTNVFVLIKYKLRCINDLVHEINKLNVRIELVNPKPFMLIKADDSEIYRRFTMYVKWITWDVQTLETTYKHQQVKIFAFSKKVGQGQRILNLPFGQISWEQLI